MAFGVLLTLAASPPAAERIGADSFMFAKRQFVFLPIALMVMLCISLASPRHVRRLALLVFCGSLVLLALTFVIGVEIKGARRWISVPGLSSVQPSEFVKPSLAVISAWLLAQARAERRAPGYMLSTLLVGATLALLLMQPDLGMSIVVASVWAAQLFVVGLPMWVAGFGVIGGMGSLVGAYFFFNHVRSRFDRFLDPSSGDNYQVNTALEAFMNGSLFGRGPGEGTVKAALPDAHTDFIMAVCGEEFGLVCCLLVLGLFAFVTLRTLSRASKETSLFITLAATGLGVQFGLQAAINMASTIQLIPAKGMTLPFISYGGSSALAMAICVGMLLSLTREHAGLREAV
jgi:cell division protein FtsW